MSANLTLPEGAYLTPDGYCHRCGNHPVRSLLAHLDPEVAAGPVGVIVR